MKSRKRNPFIRALLIAILCIAVGTVIGWVYGIRETHSIAEAVRQHSPDDPLDGLPIISMGITFTGMIIGAVTGIIGAIIYYARYRAKEKVQ